MLKVDSWWLRLGLGALSPLTFFLSLSVSPAGKLVLGFLGNVLLMLALFGNLRKVPLGATLLGVGIFLGVLFLLDTFVVEGYLRTRLAEWKADPYGLGWLLSFAFFLPQARKWPWRRLA